jgi:hypothetical protein
LRPPTRPEEPHGSDGREGARSFLENDVTGDGVTTAAEEFSGRAAGR